MADEIMDKHTKEYIIVGIVVVLVVAGMVLCVTYSFSEIYY